MLLLFRTGAAGAREAFVAVTTPFSRAVRGVPAARSQATAGAAAPSRAAGREIAEATRSGQADGRSSDGQESAGRPAKAAAGAQDEAGRGEADEASGRDRQEGARRGGEEEGNCFHQRPRSADQTPRFHNAYPDARGAHPRPSSNNFLSYRRYRGCGDVTMRHHVTYTIQVRDVR